MSRVGFWNPKVADEQIMHAAMDRLEKVGHLIADKARQKVPIGKNVRAGAGKWSGREAGALRSSIRVVRLKGDPNLNIRVYAGSTKVFYARWVEYGTAKMKARPFLRPALNASKAEAQRILDGGV